MKKSLYFIFCLAILLVILFFPKLVSTPLGRVSLSRALSNANQKIELSSLHLRWLGPQEIDGLSLTNAHYGLTGHIQKITLHTELWNLFFSKKNLKNTLISEPIFEIKSIHKPLENSNSPQASPLPTVTAASVGPSSKHVLKTIKNSAPFLFKGIITIEKGMIELNLQEAEKIRFLDIRARVEFPSYSLPTHLTFSCQTLQNNTFGKAQVQAGLLDQEQIEMQASADHLPISGIDNLIALEFPQLKGLLYQCVGSTLDLKLDGLLSKSSFNLSLSASSPNLLAELHTKKEGEFITFLSPATLSVNLTPTFLENLLKLTDLPPLLFHSDTQLYLKVPHFALPMQKSTPDFSSLALDGEISFTPTTFTLSKIDKTIRLSSFKCTFNSKDIHDRLRGALDISLAYLDKVSSVKILGELTSLTQGEVTAHIQDFPTALLDKNHYSSLLLGTTLNLDISGKWSNGQATGQFQLNTPALKIPSTQLSFKEPSIFLDGPTTITYTPSRPLLDFLKIEKGIFIQNLASLQLSIEEFTLPNRSDLHPLKLKGVLEAKDLTLYKIPLFDLMCHLDIDTLDTIHCEIESPTLQTELFLATTPQFNSLEFKKPTHLKYLVTKDLFEPLLASFHLENTLETPSLSDITLEPFSLPLNQKTAKPLLLKGSGTIDALTFKSPHLTTAASLEEIAFKFTLDQKGDKLLFDLDEKAKFDGQNSGTINLSVQLRNLFTANPLQLVAGKAQLKHLRTPVINTLFGLKTPLQSVLGPTLDFSFEATEKTQAHQIQIDAAAQHLKGSLTFIRNEDGTLFANKPSSLEAKITPEGLKLVEELSHVETTPHFTLASPTSLNITLSHFNWPKNFDRSSIFMEFRLNSLSMQGVENKRILTLGELEGTFKKGEEKPLEFSIGGKSAPSGEIHFVGTLHNLVDENGKVTPKDITTHLDGDFHQFPTPFIDLFARSFMQKDFHLTTMLGNTINATLKSRIEACSGDVHLNVFTDHAKVSLEGMLKEGMLTLTSPLHAQFEVTQEMSEFLLKHANPLGISSFKSNDPITLEVSEKGFSFPLFPYQIQEVNVGTARLELGIITSENRGNLKSVLKLLRAGQFSHDKTLELWFTPIDVHIHQGVMDVQRTEIFVDQLLELAIWGTIDFPQDRVDMVLGLTEHTLQNAFHINNLPADYLLHIPLTGTTGNISYNKIQATSKIASLLAWQQTSKEKSNGSIWDGLLKAVGTLPDKDAKNPPAKKPLPWEAKKKAEKKALKATKKKKPPKQPTASRESPQDDSPVKKNTNPFKELFRALK